MSYCRCLLILLALAAPALVNAAEIQVQAPVVNVEPITAPDTQIEECPAKPQSGLAATLRWDLGLQCTIRTVGSDRIDGYRVYYRWDDRVHSQIMTAKPGDYIGLTLKIN